MKRQMPMTRLMCAAAMVAVAAMAAMAIGCGAVEDDGGCSGIAGCPAPVDSVGYTNGGAEVEGDPAVFLVHERAGTRPHEPHTRFMVAWRAQAVRVEALNDANQNEIVKPTADVTTEQLSHATRVHYPSGAIADLSLDRANGANGVGGGGGGVAITFRNGDTSLSVLCRATPDTVVCN